MSLDEAKKALKERQSTFSLEKCIKKYGEEEGLKKFNERQQKWQNSLKSHGEEYLKELNEKRNVKNSYIKKYGEEEGLKKFNELVNLRTKTYLQNMEDKKSGKWFFNKYDDEETAKKKWEEWKNQPKKYSYEWYLYRNKDEKIALEKYENYKKLIEIKTEKVKSGYYYKQKYGDDWENIIKTKTKIGKASKESLKLFVPLYKILRKQYKYNLYDILFGIKGLKEYLLYDKETKTRKLYDFTILSEKIIFEFNGDRKIYKKSKK